MARRRESFCLPMAAWVLEAKMGQVERSPMSCIKRTMVYLDEG